MTSTVGVAVEEEEQEEDQAYERRIPSKDLVLHRVRNLQTNEDN